MKKDATDALSTVQEAELQALSALPEGSIDTTDNPEQVDWAGARRGVFFRAVKKQLSLRLDADVVDWFKRRATGSEGYQTTMNKALREYMLQRGGN